MCSSAILELDRLRTPISSENPQGFDLRVEPSATHALSCHPLGPFRGAIGRAADRHGWKTKEPAFALTGSLFLIWQFRSSRRNPRIWRSPAT